MKQIELSITEATDLGDGSLDFAASTNDHWLVINGSLAEVHAEMAAFLDGEL